MNTPARFTAGITRYVPGDAEELVEFRLRTFGPGTRQVDPGRQNWLFSNPYADAGRPGLWVCRREDEIVGQQAEIAFELQVGQDPRRAAWAIDLMVDPAWQLRGIGPGLIATQLAERTISLGLNLSDKGLAAYKRMGWADLGIVPQYVRPLEARRTLANAPVPAWLRRLAPVAGPGLRTADALMAGMTRASGAHLQPVDRLDDRVDRIWAMSASYYRVLARRDLEALRWRIDERPDRDRLRRYYLIRHNQPLGYVVLRPTQWSPNANSTGSTARRRGVTAAVVVDYLAPPRWVAPLLLAAGRAARREGAIAMLVKTRNVPADRRLRAAGFVRRDKVTDSDMPIRFMVHCSDEPGICALVSDPESWFVTAADSDLEYATVDTPTDDAT